MEREGNGDEFGTEAGWRGYLYPIHRNILPKEAVVGPIMRHHIQEHRMYSFSHKQSP